MKKNSILGLVIIFLCLPFYNFTCVWSDRDFPDLELKQAVEDGNVEKAQELVKKGANPDESNGNGVRLLHVAVDKGNVGMIKFLIAAGANINYWDQFSRRPASGAYDNFEAVKVLVEAGADEASIGQLLDLTSNFEIIDYLASKGHKRDINSMAIEPLGICGLWIPLTWMAQDGKLEAVKEALKRGARNFCQGSLKAKRSDETGPCGSPSDYAKKTGHPEIAKLILDSEAQYNESSPIAD